MQLRQFNELDSIIDCVENIPDKNLKLCINVPVHKEYENGSLFRFLLAFLRQKGADFSSFELNFLVNRLSGRSADKHVSEDDLASLDLLKRLANRDYTLPFESDNLANPRAIFVSRILREAQEVGLRVNLFDATNRQLSNIGQARNYLAQVATLRLQEADIGSSGIIAQMDADSQVETAYVSKTLKVFKDPEVETLFVANCFASEYVISRQAATYFESQLEMCYLTLGSLVCNDRTLPSMTSCRIITRASALSLVGGVPELDKDEDFILGISLLANTNIAHSSGIWVNNEDRARAEGYDANNRLNALYSTDFAEDLASSENRRRAKFMLKPLMDEMIKKKIITSTEEIDLIVDKQFAHRKKLHNLRKDHLIQLITKLHGRFTDLDERELMTSTTNPWIGVRIAVLRSQGKSLKEVIETFKRDYPEWLEDFDSATNAQLVALYQSLIMLADSKIRI